MKRILHIYPKVTNGTLDLRVPEQDLDGTQVASRLVDDGYLCPTQGIRPVLLRSKTYRNDPLINQPGILPGAQMLCVICAAREGIVLERTTTTLEPRKKARPGRFKDLELHRATGLLLDDYSSTSDTATKHEIADAYFHNIAAPQLAINRQIEERAIPKSLLTVKPKADCPDLLWFGSTLSANQSARVPGRTPRPAGSNSECPMFYPSGPNGPRWHAPNL